MYSIVALQGYWCEAQESINNWGQKADMYGLWKYIQFMTKENHLDF